jgi:L-2-hydroxyglutarate oxidase LhgO
VGTVDCVVVGAGVIGLAAARALAQAGWDTLVIEQADRIGTGISSRSSEVIHAGLYYPPGSLKARLCVEGRDRLWAYCAERGIAHLRCGKLVVAPQAEQVMAIETILATATANAVADLSLLDGAEARALEPELRCEAALLSPSTGVLDSHAYMLALQADAEAAGATFAFNTPVSAVRREPGRLSVCVNDQPQPAVKTRVLVNAAGLGAVDLAGRIEALAPARVPRLRWAKGSYFALAGRAPFSRLIYPQPELGGLGVHLTLDLGGQARFGPDVEWVDRIDYDVDPARAQGFEAAIRTWWPDLPTGRLSPAYAAVRPKLSGPGEPAADFRIDGPAVHGVPGLVNLFGIESPGLTASLALADEVAGVARETLEASGLDASLALDPGAD